MNTKLTKMIRVAIFTLVACAAFSPVTAKGQGGDLVGAWDMVITFRDCDTAAPLRERPGIISFMFGGVTQEFGTGQQIPQNRTDAHGNWSHRYGKNFYSVSKSFRFNADGSVAGTAKLFRNIQVDGGTFSAYVRSEIYDPNGVLVSQGCATEAGTRIE